MKWNLIPIPYTIAVALLTYSCSDSSFTGNASQKKSEKAQTKDENSSDATGDTAGNQGDGEMITNTFTYELNSESRPLDIILLFDTSGSMRSDGDNDLQESDYLAQSFPAFLDAFVKAQQGKMDFNIYIISDTVIDLNAGAHDKVHDSLEFAPGANPADFKVDSHDSVCQLEMFLRRNQAGAVQPALRENSLVEVVIFTDDELHYSYPDCQGEGRGKNRRNSPTFVEDTVKQVNFMVEELGMSERLTFNASVGYAEGQDNNSPWCDIQNVGAVYQQLATNSKGTSQDLCLGDWDAMMGTLSDTFISKTISNTFPLSDIPENMVPDSFVVKINKKKVTAKDCYAINKAKTAVTITDTCLSEDRDSVIEISFTVVEKN